MGILNKLENLCYRTADFIEHTDVNRRGFHRIAGAIAVSTISLPVLAQPQSRQSTYFWGSNVLPERVDYWELASSWYQSKGMSPEKFDRLKEEKRKYRSGTGNETWPGIKDKHKVQVMCDNEAWKSVKEDTNKTIEGIFIINNSNPYYDHLLINPNVNFTADRMEIIMLHEAWHSIQDRERIPEHPLFENMIRSIADLNRSADATYYLIKKHELDLRRIDLECGQTTDVQYDTVLDLFMELYHPLLCESDKKYVTPFSEALDLLGKVNLSYLNKFPLQRLQDQLDALSPLLTSEEDRQKAREVVSGVQEILTIRSAQKSELDTSYRDLAMEMRLAAVDDYFGSTVELEPRLLEVGRFFYESQGRVIMTPKEAGKAFSLFIDGDVPQKYKQTQRQLKAVRAYHLQEGQWKEAQKDMFLRMPGLL